MYDNEEGYVLLESLAGLIILSIISFSLLVVLPVLLETNKILDVQQQIYHTLFERYDRQLFYDVKLEQPYPMTITATGNTLCATYIWRQNDEMEICL